MTTLQTDARADAWPESVGVTDPPLAHTENVLAAAIEPSVTTVPSRDRGELGPQPYRSFGATEGGGVRNLAGAAVTGVCVALLLFGRLAAFSGLIGFVVVAYPVFLGSYALLVSLDDDRQVVIDRVISVLLYSIAALLCVALAFIVLYTFFRGWAAMVHLNFYTQDLRRAGPKQRLGVGGIKHAIIGTLWVITIAIIITVPLGLTAAVYLNQSRTRLSRFVRTIVEAMTALPSIIAGLFVFATWILILHQEKAGLAGSLAISVDMLPIIIRAADVVLNLVPGNLKEASAALGSPRWRTVRHVILPTARSGLATAVILGIARGIGETAPILLTVGYTKRTNIDPFHSAMVSLPLAAFELVRSGEPRLIARGYGAAAFLLLLVTALFIVARLIGGRGPGTLSKGQARRAQRGSARDANRIIHRHKNGVVNPMPEPITRPEDA